MRESRLCGLIVTSTFCESLHEREGHAGSMGGPGARPGRRFAYGLTVPARAPRQRRWGDRI